MRIACLFAFIVALLSAVAGCVERKERLVISPDGSLLWQVNMRSDSLDDLLKGDAVPTPGGLWIVQQGEERDEEGKVTFTLAAETAIRAHRRLPDGFGTQAELAEGVALRFPTTVTIEKRKDATYCHFTRRYDARVWRAVDSLREEHINSVAGGLGPDPALWTPEQRLAICQGFARFEVEKAILFARVAWLETLPDEPQDQFLAVADEVRGLLLTLDYARLSNLLAPPPDAAAEAGLEQAIELEGKQLQDSIVARLGEAAQGAGGLEGSKAAMFLAACDRQRRIFEVTEDLNDDGFEIEVEMPGIVIASNASQLNGGASGNTVTFKFKGEQLHDNAIELLATSKIAR